MDCDAQLKKLNDQLQDQIAALQQQAKMQKDLIVKDGEMKKQQAIAQIDLDVNNKATSVDNAFTQQITTLQQKAAEIRATIEQS